MDGLWQGSHGSSAWISTCVIAFRTYTNAIIKTPLLQDANPKHSSLRKFISDWIIRSEVEAWYLNSIHLITSTGFSQDSCFRASNMNTTQGGSKPIKLRAACNQCNSGKVCVHFWTSIRSLCLPDSLAVWIVPEAYYGYRYQLSISTSLPLLKSLYTHRHNRNRYWRYK